jgi:hypothetical protein
MLAAPSPNYEDLVAAKANEMAKEYNEWVVIKKNTLTINHRSKAEKETFGRWLRKVEELRQCVESLE